MNEVYAGMLKMMDTFRNEDKRELTITYHFEINQTKLLARYPIAEIAGTGTSLERAVRVMQWEAQHIYHKGDYDGHISGGALEFFDYAMDQPEERGINCSSLAQALTECLLAIGIKARTVFLMPMSPYDGDNHVVSEFFSEEDQKWVMLDPTFSLYLSDDRRQPLSLVEIRENLANRKMMNYCVGAHYNGNELNHEEIQEYYAKDFFYFQLHTEQGRTKKDGAGYWVTIAPEGYDVKKARLTNIDYRIACWGEQEWMKRWKKSEEENTPIYKGIDFLR